MDSWLRISLGLQGGRRLWSGWLGASSVGLLRETPVRFIPRLEPGEYAPYTVEYFQLVPGDDVLQHMASYLQATIDVRAGALHIAGHEQHHLDSIEMNHGGGSSRR